MSNECAVDLAVVSEASTRTVTSGKARHSARTRPTMSSGTSTGALMSTRMTESEATSEAASEQFVRAQPYGDLLNPPAGAAHHGDVYPKRNPVEFRFNVQPAAVRPASASGAERAVM